jgi:hypothetical protein
MVVFDTETCGLHGPIVLIQYKELGTEGIHLHNVWHEPISSTLELIEWLCERGVIGFNLVFDWFHIQQLYTTLLLLSQQHGDSVLAIDYINDYANLEPEARDGPCVKPAHALDLMLHAKKGPYQSTMERRNITIRRVPSVLAKSLVSKLEQAIDIDKIYFARWTIEHDEGEFSNITLRFKPSAALKVLAVHALGYKEVITHATLDTNDMPRPLEIGWAPFALALSNAEINWRAKISKASGVKRGYTWPGVIRNHIGYWMYNELAKRYANDDVKYTEELYYYFKEPDCDDDNSILACQVGSARWRGYAINKSGIQKLRAKAVLTAKRAPKAPNAVFEYIAPHLSKTELSVLQGSTKRVILEYISKMKIPCPDCATTLHVVETCSTCLGTGNSDEPHPAARYAKDCLDARKAQKEIELYDKLLQAGRLHASYKIIGTLSDRMSGADGLNPQGIKHDKYVRAQFPLTGNTNELILDGGDFISFEVSIIDAICNDEKLNTELRRCSKCKYIWPLDLFSKQIKCPGCNQSDNGEACRQKFHGLFGMGLKPGITYDEVIATKGLEDDLYDKGKRGGFSQFYGGNWATLVDRLGVDEDTAKRCEEWFITEYSGAQKFREEIYNDYCSMRQPDGLGTKVEWHEPKEYVESLLGFRRYFTIENNICRALFNLANNLPSSWREIKTRCVRRDREQTISGAAMSALYAAAFNIQAKNMRAAANHRIQSTGTGICKRLQCRLWELQPVGIHPWVIQPMNIHDEIMCPINPDKSEEAKRIVDELIEETRPLIPLVAIGWSHDLKSWADK